MFHGTRLSEEKQSMSLLSKEKLRELAELAKAYVEERLAANAAKPYASREDERPGRTAFSQPQYRYSIQSSEVIELDSVMGDLSDKSAVQRAKEFVDRHRKKTFVEKLLEHAGEKNMSSKDLYKSAQIDRKLFSKIQNDPAYKPSRDTCLALAYALGLSFDEAGDLLSRAGYSFSESSRRDILLQYFFMKGCCDLDTVNEVLYTLGERILGESRF